MFTPCISGATRRLLAGRRFLRIAAKSLVDDGLQMLHQFIGRRLVIVQLIHFAKKFVLAQAEAVIGQQFVVDHILVRANERQNRANVLFIGIDAWNQGRAGDEVDVRKRLVGFLEVLQNALVVDADPLLVPLRESSSCDRAASYRRAAAPFPQSPRYVARRFDGRVETALVRAFQQCGTEVRLQQALATAERDAAAGSTDRRRRPSPLPPVLRRPSCVCQTW